MVATRLKNTTEATGAADKTPAKKGRYEDVEATPSAAAAAAAAATVAARPRRTCRKTAGVHAHGSSTTATTKKTGKKKPPRTPAAKGSTTADTSKKKKATAGTPAPSSRTSSVNSQTGRAKRINYHDPKSFRNALDWDYARCDPSVASCSLAKAYKLDGEKRKGMVYKIEPNSPAMRAAGGAWDRFRKNPSTEGPARLRVEADLRAKAAAGVLFENLDPVRITAVNTFGGPAVFGFRTAAAAGATATGATGDIVLPGPSAAAAAAATANAGADVMPAWWGQAYAEQQEKNRELQTQQTTDRAELQAQQTKDRAEQQALNQSMVDQIGNSNLIQQQMLVAIGNLQNGQQQQGAAIVDLQNGQQQQDAAIVELQNGQQQQRAAIAELQDWQQRVLVEGVLGGTKANLEGSRFGSIDNPAPPAAIGVHGAVGAAQAAPNVNVGGSPPSPDRKMPARPVPISSSKPDDIIVDELGGSDGKNSALQSARGSSPSLGRGRGVFGTGVGAGGDAGAGGRSTNGACPSSSPDTFAPFTNRNKSAPPSLSPPSSPPRSTAPSFGSPDADILFGESIGGHDADASTPPTAMVVKGRGHPPHRPSSLGRKKKCSVAIMPASDSGGADDDRLYMMFDDTSALPPAELKAFARQLGVEGLPDCFFGSVVEYSKNLFRVNKLLREGRSVAMLPKKDYLMVKSVSLALQALPVFSFGQYCVYRGVYFEEQKDVFRFRDLWHDGKPFVEPSFLSTSALHIESPELNAFNGRNTFFAIFSKTGRLIQRHSDEDWKKETEVLFDLGKSFRILSFDDTMPDKEHGTGLDQAGRYRIVMEEIQTLDPDNE